MRHTAGRSRGVNVGRYRPAAVAAHYSVSWSTAAPGAGRC